MEKLHDLIQDVELRITPDSVLFFDMDGTLVETNLANFLSYKKAIHTVAKSDYYVIYNPYKRFNRGNLKNVLPNLSENEFEKIIQEKEDCYREFLSYTKLNKVIAEILFRYSETNKTVLVTNCREDRALATLNHFGLTQQFNNIFYRQFADNERKINKFQNAISDLSISPNTVIAFENEETEIVHAKLAGIPHDNIISVLNYEQFYN